MSDYKIRKQKGKKTQVVHFDRLKPCDPRTRIEQHDGSKKQSSSTVRPCKPHVLGEDLSIETDDDKPPPPLLRDQQPLVKMPLPVDREPLPAKLPPARRQPLIPV